MALDCSTDFKNIGFADCKKLPEGVKSAILTPSTFTATLAQAVDPAFWQTSVLAGVATRCYVLPETISTEDTSTEASIEETDSGAEYLNKNKTYRQRLIFKENLAIHQNLYSHNGRGGRIFEIDLDNKLIGTYTDSTKTAIRGFKLNSFFNEGLMDRTYTTTAKFSCRYSLADNTEMDSFGAMMDFTTVYNQIIRLTNAVITVLTSPTPTGTAFTVDVKSGNDGGYAVTGLDSGGADFTIGTGTISSATEDTSVPGRYVIAGTGMAGDVNLVAANLLSVPGWESVAAVATGI